MSSSGMMQNLREIRPSQSQPKRQGCCSFADPTVGEGQPRPTVRRPAHPQRFTGPTQREGAREGTTHHVSLFRPRCIDCPSVSALTSVLAAESKGIPVPQKKAAAPHPATGTNHLGPHRRKHDFPGVILLSPPPPHRLAARP